jgi:hypothetical protein
MNGKTIKNLHKTKQFAEMCIKSNFFASVAELIAQPNIP